MEIPTPNFCTYKGSAWSCPHKLFLNFLRTNNCRQNDQAVRLHIQKLWRKSILKFCSYIIIADSVPSFTALDSLGVKVCDFLCKGCWFKSCWLPPLFILLLNYTFLMFRFITITFYFFKFYFTANSQDTHTHTYIWCFFSYLTNKHHKHQPNSPVRFYYTF
jgi:hypothetical protein